MKKTQLAVWAVVSLFTALGKASAEPVEEALEKLTKRVEALEEEKSSLGKISLSGFVDTSFSYDDNAEAGTFSLDKVVFYGAYDPVDYAGLFFDVGFEDLDSSGNDGAAVLDQGFVTFTLPGEVKFSFGKFDAPIGFEAVDAADMYQYSHALVFNYGLPTSFTGLKVDTTLAEMVDVTGYIVNGWDNNSDNNKAKTGGGRLGLRPIEGVNVGVSYVAGAEQDDDTNNLRRVVDMDLTLEPLENLVIGGELNWGTEEEASVTEPGEDADWFGALAMFHYDATSWCGLTVRYGYFKDEDGARLGSGVEERRQALTIAPTFNLHDDFSLILEYRYDSSDEPVFEEADGSLTDSNHTFAAELIYSF